MGGLAKRMPLTAGTSLVGSLSIAGSLVTGLPAGFCLAYCTFPGKKFLRALVDTLLALPEDTAKLMINAGSITDASGAAVP
jgi:tungstate transport system permease protein